MLHVYGAKAVSLWTSNIFLNLAFAYLAGAGQENSNLYYRYIMLHSKNGLNLGPPPPPGQTQLFLGPLSSPWGKYSGSAHVDNRILTFIDFISLIHVNLIKINNLLNK